VLGATEFSTEIADVATASGWRVAGYLENLVPERVGRLAGLEVHWMEDVTHLARDHVVVCGLGTTHREPFTRRAVELGFRPANIVHPSAVVSSTAAIGDGVIVGPGCVVAAYASVGDFVLVNRGALIGHHTSIEKGCTIGPGSNVAGSCRVGERVYIGMSAVVLNNLSIGARSVVAAGAVVTGDVDERVMVAGVPAEVRRRDIDGK
jgi:sugar O-acyltransferase (sialic acid O-acetyltransferase NeuD family)